MLLALAAPAQRAWPAPAAGRVWLDIGPDTLTATHTRELERILAHGLRRRDLELTPQSDGQAIWVVQVRAIATELFVLVVSGPALPGSGVSKSRRIDTAGLGPDVLPLSVAQAAEELLDAARAPLSGSPPDTGAESRAASVPAASLPLPPTVSVRERESPSAPSSSPLSPVWSLRAELVGSVDSFSSGLVAIGGGLGAHLARGCWGLETRVSLAELLPEAGQLGRVAGRSVGFALGPRVSFEPLEGLRLGLGGLGEARWVFAGGSAPGEGLAPAEGVGWAWTAIGAGLVEWDLGGGLYLHGRASVGPVVRGVRFVGPNATLGGVVGVVGAASLGVGISVW